MKRLLSASALLVAIAAVGSAKAADLPPAPAYKAPFIAPVFSWTGFYIGGTFGGHWDKDNISGVADPVGFTAIGATPALLDSAITGSLHPNGFIGGGEIGYNWQANNYVFGLEVDANAISGDDERTITGMPLVAAGLDTADFVTDTAKEIFLATFRGRLGVTFDRALLFATGGGAWGTLQTTDAFGGVGGTVVGSTSNTTNRLGWTVGGGLEYAVTYNLTIKAEYLYVDLGNFNEATPPIAGFPNTDIAFTHAYTESIARIGFNYKFDGPMGTRF
jgi:outer membrane immunogenic protein